MFNLNVECYKIGTQEFESFCDKLNIDYKKIKSIKSIEIFSYRYDTRSNRYLYKDDNHINLIYNEEEYLAEKLIWGEDIFNKIKKQSNYPYEIYFRTNGEI